MNSPCSVSAADIELDIERYELRRGGQRIRLERMPMELLILMASRGEAARDAGRHRQGAVGWKRVSRHRQWHQYGDPENSHRAWRRP